MNSRTVELKGATAQLTKEFPANKPLRKRRQVSENIDDERKPYDEFTIIRLYMREVGRYELLTPEEEVALAKRIKAGDQEARRHMICANLRLVVRIARTYEGLGLPLSDLISEGNIGLTKAVERFDPTKGGRLSTYGSWWIKQAIKRALATQSRTVRLPVHQVDRLFKIRKTYGILTTLLGRDPSHQEIAEQLGIPVEKVRSALRSEIRPHSLDALLEEGHDSSTLADVVADENITTPDDQLDRKECSKLIRELMQTLDKREATILKLRFGLDGRNEETLDEVAVKFGITRERIRQIQDIALEKLRFRFQKKNIQAI